MSILSILSTTYILPNPTNIHYLPNPNNPTVYNDLTTNPSQQTDITVKKPVIPYKLPLLVIKTIINHNIEL